MEDPLPRAIGASVSRWRVVLATVVAVLAIPSVAAATWTSTGNGRAYAKADVAPTGARPTVTVTGRNAAPDATLTMAPPPERRITAAACSAATRLPRRLTATRFSKVETG